MCNNTVGSYDCICKEGTHGDGKNDGKGCTKNDKEDPTLKIVLGNTLNLSRIKEKCFFFPDSYILSYLSIQLEMR